MKYTYESVKKDYQKLIKKYGDPDDMTGGFVDGEKYQELLRNPSKENAMNHMIRIIQYGFQDNECYNSECYGRISIYDCDLCAELKEKYS